MKKNSYNTYDTGIFYQNNTVSRPNGPSDWHFKYPHFGTFHRVLNMLRDEGFTIKNDANVVKCIRKDHYIGCRGDLELYAERYPAGFKIEFFQNVVFENPNGGRYDFNKFEKMPYLIRLQCIKYRRKIVALLNWLEDLEDHSRQNPRLAEEWIKTRYVEEWHHEQKDMNFNLSDTDGQTQEPYNGRDRDSQTIHNGDVKYFRHWNGRLYRGRVYHNINNMWWVICDRFTVRNVASFNLFDLKPQDNRRRHVKPRIPEEYQKRRKAIEDTKTKELVNELRRRGVKVG